MSIYKPVAEPGLVSEPQPDHTLHSLCPYIFFFLSSHLKDPAWP